MSDETKTIHYPNCEMEDGGEPQGDGYINICTEAGCPLFSVAEGEYPKGTRFDVTITFAPKPAR